MQSISIVGAGRMGGALAIALDKAGYEIENLYFRNSKPSRVLTDSFQNKPSILPFDQAESIGSNIIFIATQDGEIPSVVSRLRSLLNGPATIFHTSGALSSSSLADLRAIDCQVGSIHPLVSISEPVSGAALFEGAYFCIEGDDEAMAVAKKIVNALRGNQFSVPTDKKALYHASAVTASGHLVALIDIAMSMLGKCGINGPEAKEILLPLIKSTITNLESQATQSALTGTFARADMDTFEQHLNVLVNNVSDAELGVYLSLGERSLEIAERNGKNLDGIKHLREKVVMAKNRRR